MAVSISTESNHLPAGTSCNTGQATPNGKSAQSYEGVHAALLYARLVAGVAQYRVIDTNEQLGNPMQLDVKTLYLLNIVVALVTAGVSFFSWLNHRDMPGLRGARF